MYKRLILTFVLCLSLTALVQAAGPIAYYPFDGDLQEHSADVGGSGPGTTGVYWSGGATSDSPTYITGYDGSTNGAISFDQSIGQEVIMPNGTDFDAPGSITVTYWLRVPSDGFVNNIGNNGQICSMGNNHGLKTFVNYNSVSSMSRVSFKINNSTTVGTQIPWNTSTYNALPGDSTNPDAIDADVWYFMANTWNIDTGEQIIYQDAQLSMYKSVLAGRTSEIGMGWPLSVGGYAQSDYTPWTLATGCYLWGDVDEVAIWDRALTQDTIAFIYANGVPEPATLTLLGLGSLSLLYRKRKA